MFEPVALAGEFNDFALIEQPLEPSLFRPAGFYLKVQILLAF